jgi:hypothetical protein
MFPRAGDGERASTGAAEGWGGGADPSGSVTGSAIFGKVRTRAELEKLINNSVRPLYIKQEVLDEETGRESGRMETDVVYQDDADLQLVDVVLGQEKQADSSSEDSDSDQEMEDGGDPDPVLDVRRLYEGDGITGPVPEMPMPVPKPILDNRYYAVRGLRNKSGVGKDWKEAGQGNTAERSSFITPGDDRLLYNSNSFRIEDMKNVSRSFDEKGRCVTCQRGSHDVFTADGGKPVVFCLADQHFSPSVPSKDEKECMRVLRMEDASLKEVTREFLNFLDGRKLAAGSVILLGSLYQLSLDGTAQYAEDWHWCRRNMLEEVGEVLVLPLLPMPLEGLEDSDTVRSLLEFLLWFEELPDIEARLLADTRAHYKALYLGRIGEGPGWCDGRQSMRMPIRLTSIGKETRASRRLGDRPKNLPVFNIERERYWAGYLVGDLNRTFNLGLATDLAMHRTAEELAGVRTEEKTKFEIFGASNGARLAEVMEKKGCSVSCSATPGWRLTGQNAKVLAEKVESMGEQDVLVLYGLDSSCFVEMDESTFRCGPPRKGKDGRYHLRGKLTVVTGMQLDSLLDYLAVVLKACKNRQVIIVTPIPRLWLQCCLKHSQSQTLEDKERLLRELGKFRRALMGLVMKLKASKTVHLLNPLEVLNVASSVADIESVMLDQVHLLSGCYDMLADEAVRIVEGWKAGKRFPDDSGHQNQKRFKSGPRSGDTGGKKGGGKKGGRAKQPGNKSGSFSGYGGFKKW